MAFDQLFRRLKKVPVIALGLILGAIVAGEAAAQESALCRQLRADYARADRNAGGGGGGGKDIGNLQRQLAAAQNDAKRSGCRRVLFGKPGKNCPAIMARINQLQRDIARSRSGGGGGLFANNARYERDRIRAALSRNGCQAPGRGNDGGSNFASSGYRTLCVRTCDGYYFPISFSTSRSRFKIDEAVCQSMYGGEPAQLFVHQNGSPSDTAVSLRGEPLGGSTNAFAYRHFFAPACQTQLKRGLANLGDTFLTRVAEVQKSAPAKNRGPTEAPSLLPDPVVRMAPGQDPETTANAVAGFVVRPVFPDGEALIASGSEAMRQLGPDYYYRPPLAIDALHNPPQRGPVFSLIGSAQAGETNPAGATSVQ